MNELVKKFAEINSVLAMVEMLDGTGELSEENKALSERVTEISGNLYEQLRAHISEEDEENAMEELISKRGNDFVFRLLKEVSDEGGR